MDTPDMTQSLPPRSDAAGASLPALARFEFEAGKGNEGTKILMVEWFALASEADLPSPARSRIWQVSWEGKTNHLLVDDTDTGVNKRVYFLLPPGAPIPPVITISYPGGAALAVKPLPAIFPPSLGAASSDAGSRGVLHTIWAKKRLSELQDEIDMEIKTNSESVGVEMALQERQWIAEHFGLTPRPGLSANINTTTAQALPNPVSLSSPGGGKLGEKLKGLKLATSATDLTAGSTSKTSDKPLLSRIDDIKLRRKLSRLGFGPSNYIALACCRRHGRFLIPEFCWTSPCQTEPSGFDLFERCAKCQQHSYEAKRPRPGRGTLCAPDEPSQPRYETQPVQSKLASVKVSRFVPSLFQAQL